MTSIPSGPLVVPVSVPVVNAEVNPEVAAALARAQAEAALLPALPLDEVARVLGVDLNEGAEPAVEQPERPGAASTQLAVEPSTPVAPAAAKTGPCPSPIVPAQADPVSRVQLGFRDGSTSAVDDVDQARALEDLARALTSPR